MLCYFSQHITPATPALTGQHPQQTSPRCSKINTPISRFLLFWKTAFLIVAGSLFFSTAAFAALNCAVQPTCSELGYLQTISDDCPSENIIYCPFDTSYKKCVGLKQKTCTELGFTLDDKSSWCKNIAVCADDETFTLCSDIELCKDYPLVSCPEGGSCTSCLFANTITKYNFKGCPDGYKISASSCVAKTCEDYGYQTSSICLGTLPTLHNVLLGDQNTTCYYCELQVNPDCAYDCSRCGGAKCSISPTVEYGNEACLCLKNNMIVDSTL